MGYDLRPRNKKLKEIYFGISIWKKMLDETGMGYVLNYGKGIEITTYIYQAGNKGSPVSNDGYVVSAEKAKAMANVARGYIFVHGYINKLYQEMSDKDRDIRMNDKKYYTQPVCEYLLKNLLKFAEFAEKSSGFTIN